MITMLRHTLLTTVNMKDSQTGAVNSEEALSLFPTPLVLNLDGVNLLFDKLQNKSSCLAS